MQHALEYYRMPNHLRQENLELPGYVQPVSRDMTYLQSLGPRADCKNGNEDVDIERQDEQ